MKCAVLTEIYDHARRLLEVVRGFLVDLCDHGGVYEVSLDHQEVLIDGTVLEASARHCDSVACAGESVGDELAGSRTIAKEQEHGLRHVGCRQKLRGENRGPSVRKILR